MKASEATSSWIPVIEVILSRLQQILEHFIKFSGSSRIFGKTIGQMVTEVKGPVLEEFSALKVAFQNCNLKRVEAFSIHTLHYPDFLQIFDHFKISIGSCIVQKSVVAIISFVVSLWVAKQIKESLVLVVSESYHQWSSPIVVRFWRIPMFNKNLKYVFLSVGCSEMENIHTFFALDFFLNELVLHHQHNTLCMFLNNCIMYSS